MDKHTLTSGYQDTQQYQTWSYFHAIDATASQRWTADEDIDKS